MKFWFLEPLRVPIAADKLGMHNYALKIIDGYEIEYVPKNGPGYILTAKGSKVNAAEMELAKLAADEGHKIYFTPINKDRFIKNPDIIIDNSVGDIKHVTSRSPAKVGHRLEVAKEQKVTTVLMQINEEIDPIKIYEKVNEYFLKSQITHVIVRYAGKFYHIYK